MKKTIIFIFCLSLACKSNKQTKLNNNIKDSLSFELCQIYGLDQGVRNEFLWRKHINFGNAHKAIDTLNFNNIINFVEKYGFPNEVLLGKNNYQKECVEGSAKAVLLHNPHRLVNEKKYFDLFYKEVKKGNMKSTLFANIIDKYYWSKSQSKTPRVFYGSQFGSPCIQTKNETNRARIEIGLSPLKDNEFIDCEGEDLNIPKERK